MSILVVSLLAVLGLAHSITEPISIPKLALSGLDPSKGAVIGTSEPDIDWSKAGLPVHLLLGDGESLPSSSFAAHADLGWTDEGLVGHFAVTAPRTTEATDSERLFDGDSIEFFFRKPGASNDMFQVVVQPGITNGHPEPRVHFFDYRQRPQRDDVAPAAYVARSKTANGYSMTIVLPWSVIGVHPQVGEQIGTRFTVNHVEPGMSRSRFIWTGNDETNEFWNLPVVKLDAVAGRLNSVKAWMDWSPDLLTGDLHLLATPELAQATATVKYGKSPAFQVQFKLDGGRAAAIQKIDGPKPGAKPGELTVLIGGQTLHPTVADTTPLRLARFMSGAGVGSRRRGEARLGPTIDTSPFTGEEFPAVAFAEQTYLEKLVGRVKVRSSFYDPTGVRRSKATKPGRYIAKIDVSCASAHYSIYQSVFKKPAEWSGDQASSVVAAAQFEGHRESEMSSYVARKADQDAIHSLRKRLGTQIKYEYAVKVPTDYIAGSARKWPLIVYLHGSGGGDEKSWPTVKVSDGPMGVAYREANFPFIVVALRSPGGWFPPAVADAIAEVESTYAIDKSRQYLTGFSMGGFGTWNTAYDQANRFAAIAPVAAGSGDSALMPLIKGLPTWVFQGAADGTVLPQLARGAVEALKKAGGNVKYTEYPGQDHVDTLRSAYAEKELYSWFLQFRATPR